MFIIAIYLSKKGFEIEVYERQPDPREDIGWRATFCGEVENFNNEKALEILNQFTRG